MLIFPKVLFVTNKDDLAIDYLIYKFMDRKIPYLRLNSEDIVEYSITYNFADDIIVIYNAICHGLQITKNGAYSIYTSEIKDIGWLEQDAIFESPVLIQNKIEKYRDIRATVIGKQIFAVEIETNDIDKTDWRKPNLLKDYKEHKLPDDLQALIFELHKKLDLVYSAFDFILTPEGEYYFLETNPAGEWVWLERELNLPISDAIISELLH